MKLDGKNIALLISPRGTEEPEFSKPLAALRDAGAKVTVVSTKTGTAKTVNSDLDPGSDHQVDSAVGSVSASDFHGLVIPGGTVGADTLRADKDVVAFVHDFFSQGKPVGAICHAPWVLIEAGVLKGRTITSYPSLKTDITNAGATWVDKEVMTDSGLVTSRNPDDLPAFCAKLIEEFGEGRHEDQTRSA